ncbi:hypothetical protein [Sinorhizobium mexicanum]
MKRPQRNFQVEYKTSRRQTKPRANSIWGDVDLKAMASGLEDQSHPIFTSGRSLDVTVGGGETEPVNSDDPRKLYVDGRATVSSSSSIGDNAFEAQERQESEDLANPVLTVVQHVRRTSRQAAKASNKPRPERGEPVVPGSREIDELGLLEAENNRLKRLLVERLRTENAQLRKMLERF